MSDYYKYEVYRLPISKTPFTVEELDKAISEVRTNIGKFCIEYTISEPCLDLVVKRENGDGEYGFCRELLDEERVPVQICFDCIPGMKGKYYLDNVHYVSYSYYNCSEPPFYYNVESPLLNGRLF